MELEICQVLGNRKTAKLIISKAYTLTTVLSKHLASIILLRY